MGSVETRRSISRPKTLSGILPSWGGVLGDIEPCHKLDARGNRGLQFARWSRHFVQNSVDSVPDPELLFERLKVDVTRAAFQGAGHQLVHPANHRRFRGQVAQLLNVGRLNVRDTGRPIGLRLDDALVCRSHVEPERPEP